jgi:hypothetical protein
MTAMDVGRLLAIDMHMHVERDARGRYALDDELRCAAGAERADA